MFQKRVKIIFSLNSCYHYYVWWYVHKEHRTIHQCDTLLAIGHAKARHDAS